MSILYAISSIISGENVERSCLLCVDISQYLSVVFHFYIPSTVSLTSLDGRTFQKASSCIFFLFFYQVLKLFHQSITDHDDIHLWIESRFVFWIQFPTTWFSSCHLKNLLSKRFYVDVSMIRNKRRQWPVNFSEIWQLRQWTTVSSFPFDSCLLTAQRKRETISWSFWHFSA